MPVIRNADEKNLLGLSRAIDDLAGRARTKKLNPDEVQGGTFTITNPGVFGALFGLPLINQPQVAILGVGAIEKRAVVIDDAIGIRPMCHLTLGYDHRLIDGADAGPVPVLLQGAARALRRRHGSDAEDAAPVDAWTCSDSASCRTRTRSSCSSQLVEDRKAGAHPRPAAAARASRRSSRSA